MYDRSLPVPFAKHLKDYKFASVDAEKIVKIYTFFRRKLNYSETIPFRVTRTYIGHITKYALESKDAIHNLLPIQNVL